VYTNLFNEEGEKIQEFKTIKHLYNFKVTGKISPDKFGLDRNHRVYQVEIERSRDSSKKTKTTMACIEGVGICVNSGAINTDSFKMTSEPDVSIRLQ